MYKYKKELAVLLKYRPNVTNGEAAKLLPQIEKALDECRYTHPTYLIGLEILWYYLQSLFRKGIFY